MMSGARVVFTYEKMAIRYILKGKKEDLRHSRDLGDGCNATFFSQRFTAQGVCSPIGDGS